eukprot:TRINITY_DN8951_c0_g1_i2.p1 TRINITY_DN8951_c0_g1~~TRINITY_DN8951_c0_g1_i2.p1  ORF type:complete len:356 (-),score=103.36 TRINITY_DN8951_c0_g1_i2:342-1382(-)
MSDEEDNVGLFNPEEEAIEVPERANNSTQLNATANLEEGQEDVKKKRIIRNPQPKLNADRLTGPRGLHTLEDVFKDWNPKGDGHEFEDLEAIMHKMNHWTHRLFPKLPFDDTLDIIANRLGKSKVVSTHVKKIRMGMVEAIPVRRDDVHIIDEDEDEDREVARYGDDEQPASQQAEEARDDIFNSVQRQANSQATGSTGMRRSQDQEDEEDIIRREIEEEERRKREEEQRRREEEEDELMREMEMDMEEDRNMENRINQPANPLCNAPTNREGSKSPILSKPVEERITRSISPEKEKSATDLNKSAAAISVNPEESVSETCGSAAEWGESEDLLSVDEIMQEMDQE